MSVANWFRRPFRAAPKSRRPARAPLSVEALETRLAPAAFAASAAAADGAAGSLRAAIIAANGNGQDDVITLTGDTYQLSVANTAGQENAARQGDLDLTEAGHTI